MKKVTMLVAAMGMFGGVFAESTTVNQPVSAVVTNVCTYAVNSQQNVAGATYNQGNKALGTSNALVSVDSSVAMGSFYIFRCTSNTPWDTAPYSKTGTVTLSGSSLSNTGKTLAALYTVTTEEQPNTVNGDIHSAGVNFTIPNGQWQSSAGNYAGVLSVTINYN